MKNEETRKLVDAIISDDRGEAVKQFKQVIGSKVNDYVANRKIEVAQNLFKDDEK